MLSLSVDNSVIREHLQNEHALKNMPNFINSKLILGLMVGFMIGIMFHFRSSMNSLVDQSSYAYRKLDTSAEAGASAELERTITEQVKEASDLSTLEKVQEITRCMDIDLQPSIKQRGNYWVLYNYVQAEKTFHCYESITYTTQSDYTFLDNLIPLVDRWKGPISVALYAPGEDFHVTVDSIAYLRNCETPLIKKFVTFHIFFEGEHIPKQVEKMTTFYMSHEYDFDCEIPPPYVNVTKGSMYKTRYNLTYPINVGRNVAREMSQTHFLFASDIELYPTRNFIQKFLKMVSGNEALFTDESPKVFVLPIYEIIAEEEVPENKTQLQALFKAKKAFLFHGKICPQCHSVPKQIQWMRAKESSTLKVYSQTKRIGKFEKWEAFYIGTNAEPLFDERLTWEGQSNKMTQGFAMCLLDYTYMVLDNAFVIHKPGIKKKKVQMQKYGNIILETNKLIKSDIKPQLELMYGKRRGCFV